MNKFKILSAFFIVVIIIVLSVIFIKNKKCVGLKCLILNQSSDFVISDIYENTPSIFRALYQQSPNSFLRIEIKSAIEKNDSEKLLSSKINHLSDIFENSISPYPGEISVQTSCADKYKPKLTQSNRLPYFIGYLNDRLQFGSCSEDQAKNQGAIGFLYCPNQKKFYQIEYIVPVQSNEDKTNQIKNFIEAIDCQK